jgi:hypothetical protein
VVCGRAGRAANTQTVNKRNFIDFGKLFLQRCQTHFVQGEGAAGEESPSAAKPKSLPDRAVRTLPGASILLRVAQFFPEKGSKVIKRREARCSKFGAKSFVLSKVLKVLKVFISRPLLFIGRKTLWVDSIPGFKFAQI